MSATESAAGRGIVTIETDRFTLRELGEGDVTQRYLDWFSDPDSRAYISAAENTKALDDLYQYVRERAGREDILFLAILDRATGQHIGNVKYEPVDSERGYAIMGILIGDTAWRGKGVAAEVLAASGVWLKEHRGIREIVLRVFKENAAAVHAYERVGYRIASTPHLPNSVPTALTMVWTL